MRTKNFKYGEKRNRKRKQRIRLYNKNKSLSMSEMDIESENFEIGENSANDSSNVIPDSVTSINHRNVENDDCNEIVDATGDTQTVENRMGIENANLTYSGGPCDENDESSGAMDTGESTLFEAPDLTNADGFRDENDLLQGTNSEEAVTKIIEGRRIVEIEFFLNQIRQMSAHNNGSCSFNDLIPQKEIRRGLFSKIIFRCKNCDRSFRILTNEDEKKTDTIPINSAAVLATNIIGIGYSQFEQFASVVDVPIMSADKYKTLNDQIGEQWEKTALEEMKKAAAEERQAAIDRGDVDEDGIPFITVVCDCCWCKRSYHKNFTALSGVSAIVGAHTGKLLWIGVKNKYCVTCVRHSNKEQTPPPHSCTRNFTGSSSEMEWQSLLEGFKSSIEMYNMRYMKLIADGDSSTHAKLVEHEPYPHRYIEKIECTNHLFRNYRKQLEASVKGCPSGMRKLVVDNLERIRKDILCAVKYRKGQDTAVSEKLASLKSDIGNVVHHVFGNHANCPDYVNKHCKGDKDHIPALAASGTLERLLIPTRRLMYCANDLLLGETNNVAEHYNSIVAKFVGGKRINFSLSNSYKHKANAAAVQFNTKSALSAFYQSTCKRKPTALAQKIELKRLQKCDRERARRIKMRALKVVRKRFSSTKASGPGYGGMQGTDLSESDFEIEKATRVAKLKKNQENRHSIEENTRDKFKSPLWRQISSTVLMASSFGAICKARVLPSHVKELSRSNHKDTKSMKHENESLSAARQQLASEQNICIEDCGLYIDEELMCLAASPTGVDNVSGMMVVIKCPTAIINKDPTDPSILATLPYIEVTKEKIIVGLKKNDNIYYEIQGVLHICNKDVCLFAIWSSNQCKVYVEQIERDKDFFESKMKSKLSSFYYDWLLPELADPRLKRNMTIRTPNL